MRHTWRNGILSKRREVSARKIRRADQSDLAVVQGISADAYIAAYVPMLGYIPLPAEEDYVPRIERGEVWLLACGDSDIGVAVLEERRDHLLVYSIAVRPTEQGSGHGRALLDFADQRAPALGLTVIGFIPTCAWRRTSPFIGDMAMLRPAPARIPAGWVKCSSIWYAPCRRAPLERLHCARSPAGHCYRPAADVATIRRTSALRRCGSGWSWCRCAADVRRMHQAGGLVKHILDELESELL